MLEHGDNAMMVRFEVVPGEDDGEDGCRNGPPDHAGEQGPPGPANGNGPPNKKK